MKAQDQLDRLIKLNQLIMDENTGSPEMLAKKLGISKRQLFGKLEFFRDSNVPVSYSRSRQTYYFPNGKGLEISYTWSSSKKTP